MVEREIKKTGQDRQGEVFVSVWFEEEEKEGEGR